MTKKLFVFSCVMIVLSGSAFGQAPPTPTTPPTQTATPPVRTNCAPTESTSQGNIVAQGSTAQRAEPLGDKLAKADGVLCPPSGVDPAIRAPTPDTGNTPVIPPPGSPGGDPTIRPK